MLEVTFVRESALSKKKVRDEKRKRQKGDSREGKRKPTKLRKIARREMEFGAPRWRLIPYCWVEE
ncbi:hypothetical protein T439DRAFT_321239, partial [Meredithblackwellia eburnea MCA 4105]